MLKLQRTQNTALRWVHPREHNLERTRNEELHAMYKVEPLNVRIHKLAKRTWEKLHERDDPNFPRSKPRALGELPIPIFR